MSAQTVSCAKKVNDTCKRDEYKGIYVEESSEEKCANELGYNSNHTKAMLQSIRESKRRLQADQRAQAMLYACGLTER